MTGSPSYRPPPQSPHPPTMGFESLFQKHHPMVTPCPQQDTAYSVCPSGILGFWECISCVFCPTMISHPAPSFPGQSLCFLNGPCPAQATTGGSFGTCVTLPEKSGTNYIICRAPFSTIIKNVKMATTGR